MDLVSHYRDAGFTDAEITEHIDGMRQKYKQAGFSDEEIDQHLGIPPTPKEVPPALIDRMIKGQDFAENIKALPDVMQAAEEYRTHALDSYKNAAKGIVNQLLPKSLGGELEPAKVESPTDVGGFLETGKALGTSLLGLASLPFAPLIDAVRNAVGQGIVATDAVLREGAVNLYGEEKVAEAQKALGEQPGPMTPEEAKKRADMLLMAVGSKPMKRIGMGPAGQPVMETVGPLPKGEDFSEAGRGLGNGDTTQLLEDKFQRLYKEAGIHPAEVVADAQRDPTITQSMLSSDKSDMPVAYHGSMDVITKFDPERTRLRRGLFFSENPDLASKFAEGTAVDSDPKMMLGEDKPEAIKKWVSDNVSQKDASRINAKVDQAEAIASRMEEATPGSPEELSLQQKYGEIVRDLHGDLSLISNMEEGAPNVSKVRLDLGKTYEYDFGGKFDWAKEREAIDYAQSHGYDSVTFKNSGEQGVFYSVFSGDQVKTVAGETAGKAPKLPPEDILTERLPSSAGAAARQMPTYSDAEKQILSKISIGEKSPERKLTWGGLYTNFIDRLFPISKAVKEAGLADLTEENNPYVLARLLSGHAGKADHFLNQGTFDFATYENNGKSLKEILAPVSRIPRTDPLAEDLNGFRAYATAARAIELESRGIKSGFDAGSGAPPLVSEGLDAARTVVAEGREKYEKPFREMIDYQNRVAAYARDAGVLSKDGYKAMVEANKMYVPFSRVMGFDEGAAARNGSSLQAHNPIKAIKGSGRDIVDPIESVVRNTYHLIEMAEKNVVGTKLIDMLKRASEELPGEAGVEQLSDTALARGHAMAEALGEVMPDLKTPKKGSNRAPIDDLAEALAHATEPRREGEIAILRDGKRETYKVDPDLARAMKGLDAQSMGLIEKMLAFPASTLRAGAVLSPDFMVRHTIRDFMYAATTFKGGVFSPIDMAKGFLGLITKDADYWNWLKGGGGNISVAAMDRRYLQEDVRKLTAQTGLVGRAWNVLADPEASMWSKAGELGKLPFRAIDRFVLDPLRVGVQFAENASHLAAFKKGMRASERAEPEATNLRDQVIRSAWISRDTAVDAARMGANMRAYNMITAFANIKLQDTDRVVRAIRDNPIPTLAKIGGAITLPSVILWAANHQDPRYDELPQWQKDLFFIVMTPDHIIRIPKPWAMGMIFGSLPERLLDSFYRGKPDSFKKFGEDMWAVSGPDFIPTAGAPIIDQAYNHSVFTNRTLIPSDMEKLLPEYQYTPYTHELTKQLGQIIGAFPGISQLKTDHSGWGGTARALTSPILMENYIRGWTGTLGMYALEAADAGLRKAGVIPDPPKPAWDLADIPVVKAFVIRYPTASTESIQNFYDEYEKNKAYFATYQAKAKDGDVAAMQHIADMGGDMMFAKLDGFKQVLSEHSKLIRDIWKNPQIQPAEKRQLIDQLYYAEIQVGQAGMQAVREMRRESDLKQFDARQRVPFYADPGVGAMVSP